LLGVCIGKRKKGKQFALQEKANMVVGHNGFVRCGSTAKKGEKND